MSHTCQRATGSSRGYFAVETFIFEQLRANRGAIFRNTNKNAIKRDKRIIFPQTTMQQSAHRRQGGPIGRPYKSWLFIGSFMAFTYTCARILVYFMYKWNCRSDSIKSKLTMTNKFCHGGAFMGRISKFICRSAREISAAKNERINHRRSRTPTRTLITRPEPVQFPCRTSYEPVRYLRHRESGDYS